jgi:hypothetical protein
LRRRLEAATPRFPELLLEAVLRERAEDLPRLAATLDETFPFLMEVAFFAGAFFGCWAFAPPPTDDPTKIARMIKNESAMETRCRFLISSNPFIPFLGLVLIFLALLLIRFVASAADLFFAGVWGN